MIENYFEIQWQLTILITTNLFVKRGIRDLWAKKCALSILGILTVIYREIISISRHRGTCVGTFRIIKSYVCILRMIPGVSTCASLSSRLRQRPIIIFYSVYPQCGDITTLQLLEFFMTTNYVLNYEIVIAEHSLASVTGNSTYLDSFVFSFQICNPAVMRLLIEIEFANY